MENQKTCADCINLGREVYCMKCKRLNNGYQDMFTEQSKIHQYPISKNVPSGSTVSRFCFICLLGDSVNTALKRPYFSRNAQS